MMKFFISLVALAMANEKRLDIDAPLSQYLDDLRSEAPIKSEAIKVRHLKAWELRKLLKNLHPEPEPFLGSIDTRDDFKAL